MPSRPSLPSSLTVASGKFAGLVPLHDVGRDFALGKFAHAFLQLKLFVVELEIQDAVSVSASLRTRNIGLEHSQFQQEKLPPGDGSRVLPMNPPRPWACHALYSDRNRRDRRIAIFDPTGRSRVSEAPDAMRSGVRMNRSNTSFDNSLPRSRQPDHITLTFEQPQFHHSEIVSANVWTADSLEFRRDLFQIHALGSSVIRERKFPPARLVTTRASP